MGKTQPSPPGSGGWFPRGWGDTWVTEAARDTTCCSARARPCGQGVLPQTLLTQGSTQVRAHRPGQVGSGSPRDPSPGLSGARGVARAWRRAGRSCRTVAFQTGSQEGPRERVTPAGAQLGGGKQALKSSWEFWAPCPAEEAGWVSGGGVLLPAGPRPSKPWAQRLVSRDFPDPCPHHPGRGSGKLLRWPVLRGGPVTRQAGRQERTRSCFSVAQGWEGTGSE